MRVNYTLPEESDADRELIVEISYKNKDLTKYSVVINKKFFYEQEMIEYIDAVENILEELKTTLIGRYEEV